MPDFVSSPVNFCHLLLSFVGYFDVFPYLFNVLVVLSPRPDNGSYVGYQDEDLRHIKGRVLEEVQVSKDEGPVYGIGGHSHTRGESRQVVTLTHDTIRVLQHLSGHLQVGNMKSS